MFARINSWNHVLIGSIAITLLSVTVPVGIVSLALWDVPLRYKLPWLAVAGFIPLFIAFPVSIFALNILRKTNGILDRLDEVVRFDGLTGILNRNHFFHMVEKGRVFKSHFAIVDADNFKEINDTHGHQSGDEALKYLARQLNEICGPYGLVGRIGGEEFAIYLPGLGLAQSRLLMAAVGDRLRNSRIRCGDTDIGVTVSIGLVADDGNRSLTYVIRVADKCLYAAKKAGRDCCFVANDVDEPVPIAA